MLILLNNTHFPYGSRYVLKRYKIILVSGLLSRMISEFAYILLFYAVFHILWFNTVWSRTAKIYRAPAWLLFLCFSVLLALRLPRLGKRERES